MRLSFVGLEGRIYPAPTLWGPNAYAGPHGMRPRGPRVAACPGRAVGAGISGPTLARWPYVGEMGHKAGTCACALPSGAVRRMASWRRRPSTTSAPSAAMRLRAGSDDARAAASGERSSRRRTSRTGVARRPRESPGRSCASTRSSRPRRSGSRPACRSSTAFSAAVSCRHRSCSCPAIPASGSPPCC